MGRPSLQVYASGSKEGGGSGFENLVAASRDGRLDADIVSVVSNHEKGGVQARAQRLGVPFVYMPPPYTAEAYRDVAERSGAEFFALSGWLKLVQGIDPRVLFNIHPGPLPETKGMHGHHVHEERIAAFRRAEATHTAICMHFATSRYDEGPVFFRLNLRIVRADDAVSLGKRVNAYEHIWQPHITNMVVHRQITWDGSDPASLRVPEGYEIVHLE